jgi:hypothetical protein
MHSRSTQAGRGAESRNGIAIFDKFGTTLHVHDPVMLSSDARQLTEGYTSDSGVRPCFLARLPARGAVAAVLKLGLVACRRSRWSSPSLLVRVEEFRYLLLRLGLLFHLWLEPDLIGRSFHRWEQDQLL